MANEENKNHTPAEVPNEGGPKPEEKPEPKAAKPPEEEKAPKPAKAEEQKPQEKKPEEKKPQAEKPKEPPKAQERPKECVVCSKSIEKRRYYREGKYYCGKGCWKKSKKAEEKPPSQPA